MLVVEIIGLSILSMMFANWYQPIQVYKIKFIDLFKRWNRLYNNMLLALTCSKCSGLMIGLLVTHNIYEAAVISFLSYVLNFTKDVIESWYD